MEKQNNNIISEENEILHGDLMYTLDKIRFWVTVIGIYFLCKMIINVVLFVVYFQLIMTILNGLGNYLK